MGLTDLNWLYKLMGFTELYLYLNELNFKLQGTGKSLDLVFSIVKIFEVKLNVFNRNVKKCQFIYLKYYLS